MNYRYLLSGTTISGVTYNAGDLYVGNTSHTVRGFSPNNISRTITPLDRKYHGISYFSILGATTTVSNNVPNIIQEQWYNLTSSSTALGAYLDGVPGSALDNANQTLLDTKIQFGGSATYVVNDVYGTLDFISGINIPVSGTTIYSGSSNSNLFYPKSSITNYTENVLAQFGTASGPVTLPPSTYYFQMAIWQFPGAGTADIGKSNITFLDGRGSSLSVAFNGISLTNNGSAITAANSLISYPTGTANSGGAVTFTTGCALSGSAGFTVRIDAASVNAYVDLTKLKTVSFNVAGVNNTSNYNFVASNLKFLSSSYQNYTSGIQTKLGILQKEPWPQLTQKNLPAIFQDTFTAYNYTYVVKFNAGYPEGNLNGVYGAGIYGDQTYGGTSTVGTALPNAFSVYLRVNTDRINYANDYLKIQLFSDPSKTEIIGYDGGPTGSSQTLLFDEIGPALSALQDYVFLAFLQDSKIRVEVWSLAGGGLNTLLFSTNNYTTNAASTGYVGYDFSPDRGNFYIDYVYAKDVITAEYTSRTFNSTLPVQGVSLYANTSAPENVISYQNPYSGSVQFSPELVWQLVDNLGANSPEWYNVSSMIDSNKIPPASFLYASNPDQNFSTSVAPSLKISKNIATDNIAGTKYQYSRIINSSRSISIKGAIYYDSILDNTTQYSTDSSTNGKKGAFRLVVWDKNFQHPIYIAEILNLIADQWNNFEVDINEDLYANELQFEIQHVGLNTKAANTTGSFWINNVQVLYRGIGWEASSNNGFTWTPFFDTTNLSYGGIRFANDIYKHLIPEDNAIISWPLNDKIVSYGTTVAQYNPSGYWPLQETSGTVAYDYSGNNYTGTANLTGILGSASTVPNISKSAYFGTTTLGYITLPNTNPFQTFPLTITAWISGTADGTLFGYIPTGKTDPVLFETINGLLHYSSPLAGAFSPQLGKNILVNDGKWHFVSAQIDYNGNVHYFVDGYIQSYTSEVSSWTGSNAYIGLYDPVSDPVPWGPGNISEFAVFPRVLSYDELLSMYYSGMLTAANISSPYIPNNGQYAGTSTITFGIPTKEIIKNDATNAAIRFAGSSIPSTISLGSATGLVSTGVSAEAWIRTGTAINQTIVASVSKNLLSAVNSNFETGIGDWHTAGGVVTQSNAQAYSGNYSLAFSGGNAASGNISAKPSQTYFVSAYIRASTVPRSCSIIIYSYDGSSWTQVATGNTATDSTTGWTQITATGTLLSNATAIAIQIQAISINEIHYIDNVSVTSQDGSLFSSGQNVSWSLSTGGSALNSGGGTVAFGIVGVGTAIGTVNYFDDKEAIFPSSAIPSWHYLVGTYDGNNVEIYHNGTILSRFYNPTTGTVTTNSGITVIGPTSGYRYQTQTAVYPYSLTNKQILRHYNAGISNYNQLKIRAKAYTEDSWIKNYEITPHYAKPGRIIKG